MIPGVRRSRSKSKIHKVQTKMNTARISLRTSNPPTAASASRRVVEKNFRLSLCSENSSLNVSGPAALGS